MQKKQKKKSKFQNFKIVTTGSGSGPETLTQTCFNQVSVRFRNLLQLPRVQKRPGRKPKTFQRLTMNKSERKLYE
jgi:hypothetical protein